MAAGAVILGVAGFAVTQGGPASADPHQVYTVVGSDTIQDVYNQFATDEGANLIGTWNATNPVNLTLLNEDITPDNAAGGQCSFSRPNGSGQGEAALRKSINQSTTVGQLGIAPGPNCIDWSRSSSGPGTDQKNDGQLVFIPFAIDAVTGSVGSESTAAFQTETNLLTSAQLTTLYNTCTAVTMPDGTQLTPNGNGNGTTILNIDLYLPQSGSGTAKFWASKTGGWSAAAPPACVHQTVVGSNPPVVVEEHDGTAVTTDASGYGPFSIAQYIAQSTGFGTNRIHSAILRNINSIAPIVNGGLNLNATFTREVYDIIPIANVTSGMTGFNSQEQQLLAGTATLASNLCRDVITITNYGFALLPTGGSATYDACGATTVNLRAFDSTDPV